MTIVNFLTSFYQSAAQRKAAFAAAQANGNVVLMDDLLFLAAVHVWRNGKHGKRNAMQIYTMCVMAKSSAIQSEYQISVARPPADQSVTLLKQAITPIMLQANERRKHDQKVDVIQNSTAAFKSLKSGFLAIKYKVGTPFRTTGEDLFDGVVASVTSGGGVIDAWVGPMMNYPGGGHLDVGQEPFKGAIARLSEGVGGGHMNVAQVGIY